MMMMIPVMQESQIHAKTMADTKATDDSKNLLSLSLIPKDAVLNLDVSCMIAQVSNLTNGFCDKEFDCEFLALQAREELASPIRPVLDALMEGKTLLCCESAASRFRYIISKSGGELEKQRASEFMSRVRVVPDDTSGPSAHLEEGKQVSRLTKTVFCTGESSGAVTVTANFHFLRAAESQGVNFKSFVHGARSLSEQKEIRS